MPSIRKTAQALLFTGALLAVGAIGASPAFAYQRGTDFRVLGQPLGAPGPIAVAQGRIFYATTDNLAQPVLHTYRTDGTFDRTFNALSMPRTDTGGRLWAWDTVNGRFVRIERDEASGTYTQTPGPTPPAEAQPFEEFAVTANGDGTFTFYVAMDGKVNVLGNDGAVLQTFATGPGQTRVAVTQSRVVIGRQLTGEVRIYGRVASGTIGGPTGPPLSAPPGWVPGSPLRTAAYETAQGSTRGELFIGRNDATGTPERWDLNGGQLPRPQYTGTAGPQVLYFARNPTGDPAQASLFQFATAPPGGTGNLFVRYAPDATGPPALDANVTFAPQNPAPGTPVQFISSVSGGAPPYGFSWTFGDGATSLQPNPIHAYATAGSYNVNLVVTDSTSTTIARQVTVSVSGGGGGTPPQPSPCPGGGGGGGTNALPVAEFAIDMQAGGASTVAFDGSPSRDPDGCIVDFDWDFGDGSGSVHGKRQTHTYARAGLYTVTLKVTDDLGGQATASKIVFVVIVTDPSLQPAEPDAGPRGVGRRPGNRQKLPPRLRKAPSELAGKIIVGAGDPEIDDVYVALSRQLSGRSCAWYEPGIPAWVRKKGCGGEYRLWISVWNGSKTATSEGNEISWKIKFRKSVPRPQGTYCLSVRVKFVDGTMWTKVPGVTYQCYRVGRR